MQYLKTYTIGNLKDQDSLSCLPLGPNINTKNENISGILTIMALA